MRFFAALVLLCLLFSKNTNALNVFIQGKWANGPEVARLLYWEDATTARLVDMKATVDPLTGAFEFFIDIAHPTLLQMENQSFIVFPGDEVNMSITGVGDDASISFEGEKHLAHSFLVRLNKALGAFPVSQYAIGEHSIEKYKAGATRHYDSCIIFLNDDVQKNALTPEFQKVAQAYLTARYYEDLLYPVSKSLMTKDALPKHYFELVDFSFFKKTDLIGFRQFILTSSQYNDYYYAAGLSDNRYDSLYIANKIKSANRNFLGEVKDHLLLSIFTDLAQEGTDANAQQVQALYEYLVGVFNNQPKKIVQIHELKREYDIVDKPLPQQVLAQQLKTSHGKTKSLKEILGTHEVVYVDFWASWSAPSIGEMPYKKQLMEELEGKNVKYVFISFDDDEKKWQKTTSKMKMKGDHYLISEGFTSELAKYISFDEVPRYLIVDKQGRLISREAPNPGSILKNKTLLFGLLE